MSGSSERVCVAAIAGAHGVHGRVKLKTFTETPEDVVSYGPLSNEDGTERYDIVRITGQTKGGVVVEMDGIKRREAVDALRGTRLYAARAALPELDDEDDFYHADLIGLGVYSTDGNRMGSIRAVYDFGAGDFLDVKPVKGKALMVPFTREAVPDIDLVLGRVTVVPPGEMEIHPDEIAAAEQAAEGASDDVPDAGPERTDD